MKYVYAALAVVGLVVAGYFLGRSQSRIVEIPATTGYGEPIQKLFKLRDGERIVAASSLDPRVAVFSDRGTPGVPLDDEYTFDPITIGHRVPLRKCSGSSVWKARRPVLAVFTVPIDQRERGSYQIPPLGSSMDVSCGEIENAPRS